MANLIMGDIIGAYVLDAMTLAVSKNDNQNGVKSKFAILSLKDEGSKGATPKRHIFFVGSDGTMSEDDFAIFAKYKATTPDARNGYPVNLQALKAVPEDFAIVKDWFRWPGGNSEDYKLRKGMCYGNDVDGKRSMKKDGTPVQTDTISVFTQVKFFIPQPDGSLKPNYFPGLGLEEQGRRIEDRFYKEAVKTAEVPQAAGTDAAATDDNNPF